MMNSNARFDAFTCAEIRPLRRSIDVMPQQGAGGAPPGGCTAGCALAEPVMSASTAQSVANGVIRDRDMGLLP
jgi:hypothetical protein